MEVTSIETQIQYRNKISDSIPKQLVIIKTEITSNVVRKVHELTHESYRILSREILDEKKTELKFDLKEVTAKELQQYRNSGKPGFVLKENDTLFYTPIPSSISTTEEKHMCAVSGHECRHLSAASDEKGGCPKVRNFAQKIEMYPFITKGYETFNTEHNIFIVSQCENYEECKKIPPKTFYELNEIKVSLAQTFWPDVEDIKEVQRRKRKAKMG